MDMTEETEDMSWLSKIDEIRANLEKMAPYYRILRLERYLEQHHKSIQLLIEGSKLQSYRIEYLENKYESKQELKEN